MNRLYPVVFTLVIWLTSSLAVQTEASDWPQFRGPTMDGSSPDSEVFGGGEFGLEVAWKQQIGSGYSSISVVGERAVTMFAEGEDDVLAAFDTTTGDELWRYRLGDRYRGHTGSDDGPTSTPAIQGDTVFSFSRTGRLVAVALDDGSEVWARDLTNGNRAVAPHYGFATTPLVAEGVVVVETGGPDGNSVSAYDRASGEPRWSIGDDPVNYQSPGLLSLASREQVVAVNDKDLIGIEPDTGEILWQHEHGTSATEAFTLPMDLGGDRILINSLQEAVALQVKNAPKGWSVEELWRSNALGRSYAIPVLHEGHLYGFKDRFLTCVDAATGKVVWKSRPPGGKGLILVDGHLVIVSSEGEIVVAQASPEGYKERARIATLNAGSYTPASFAGGQVFVRNLEEIAAIRPSAATAGQVAEQTRERELLGEFGELVRSTEASSDAKNLLEEYLAAQETFPVVEGEDLVHFIYQGEVDDIVLAGSFYDLEHNEPMDKVAGTDVYFRSLKLDPTANWEYRFVVDLERSMPDPKNPNTVMGFFGPASELRMPGWEVPEFVSALAAAEETEGPKGRLDSFEFHSDILDNTRRIQLYLPQGYQGSESRYPVVVYLYGGFALQGAKLDMILDSLIGETVAPFIAVLMPFASLEEQGGLETDQYVHFVANELVAHIDKHYRTIAEPSSRAVMGIFDGGTTAIYAALKEPEVFGMAAAQSLYLKLQVADDLFEVMDQRKGQPLEFYLDSREHDFVIVDGGIECGPDTERLRAELETRGFQVSGRQEPGSWGWGTWRNQFGAIFGGFFPLQVEK